MQLSAYSDFSFRVLMYAALRAPDRVTVDEVAAAYGISRHHLVKIVHDMGRSGYLKTQRGIGGGFTLALPPEKIGLGDIVRLGEESEAVIHCTDRSNHPCRIFPECRLKDVLGEASRAFFAMLDGYSLANLVEQPTKMKTVLGI